MRLTVSNQVNNPDQVTAVCASIREMARDSDAFGFQRLHKGPRSSAGRLGEARDRYTSFEVISIPPEDRVSASARHVTWSTRSFVRLCKRAKEEGLIAGIVHSHPGGLDGFSMQDDANERELFQLLRNRNGDDAQLVSMIQVGDALYRGRVWIDEQTSFMSRRVSVVGGTGISIQASDVPPVAPAFNRQALAFGDEVNVRLNSSP